jgi:hypothetical protein
MRRTWVPLAVLLVALGAAGCDLTEITTEPGDDVVVVEAVLRTDMQRQSLLLHRSLQGHDAGPVAGASVVVTGAAGDRHVFSPGEGCYYVDRAYVRSDSLNFVGTCYDSGNAESGWVRPGETYDLRVETTDGRVIRGRTQVPAAFTLSSLPRSSFTCALAPGTPLTLRWSRSPGAWSYVAELRASGLSRSLGGRGYAVPEPLELRAVAVSDSDTTLVLPTDFGVFERVDYDTDLLLAVRDGFPEGTELDLVVAAADRNWVNSVRGGSFNPSGLVRVSTVTGDGVGVFGSLTLHHARISVVANSPLPPCGSGA